MNGELAQLVSLVSYGNAFLDGLVASSALSSQPEVSSTAAVTFVYPSGPRSVTEWANHLRTQGVERLELDATGQLSGDSTNDAWPRGMQHALRGRAGGLIVAQTKRKSEVWHGYWDVVPEDERHDGLVWNVRYSIAFTGPRIGLSHPTVVDATRSLARSLERIRQFAEVNEQPHWEQIYRAAATVLTSKEEPSDADYALSPHAPEAAKLLLRATAEGWGFGGMGSWNDLVFDDPDATANYNRVTSEHYRATLAAIDAASNAR